MTKDRVSALCRGLDEQVEVFRSRPLEGSYPCLCLDAKQLKVRDHSMELTEHSSNPQVRVELRRLRRLYLRLGQSHP